MGENNSNDMSSESMQQNHCPKSWHAPAEVLYQSFSKHCESSRIFGNLFLFSLTWGHMGVKVSNDISSERTQQICSPKSMDTAGEGLCQSG